MLEENGEIGFGDFAGRHQRDLSRRLCRKAMERSERDTLHEDNGKSRVEDFAGKKKLEEFLGQNNIKTYS